MKNELPPPVPVGADVVFFDLDGTLMDHHGAVTRSALVFRSRHPILQQETRDRFLARWHRLIEQAFARFLDGRMTLAQARAWRIQALFSAAGQRLPHRSALQYALESVALYEKSWRLFDDVEQCLESLAGLPLGIITNGSRVQQQRKIQRLALDGRLATVIVSEACGVRKPSAAIFELACDKAGVPPHRAVHVGDDLQADAVAGRNAGLSGIWLCRSTPGPQPTPENGITKITSLSQLVQTPPLAVG